MVAVSVPPGIPLDVPHAVRGSIDEETLMEMAAPTPAAQCRSGAIATRKILWVKRSKIKILGHSFMA